MIRTESHSQDIPAHAAAGLIAAELRAADADGWLIYDFRGSNPAFARLLGNRQPQSTRRAFLWLRPDQQPTLLIHHVDAGNFERLGLRVVRYRGVDEMGSELSSLLEGTHVILMEYSPRNAIPYVSRVDAGTVELVRAMGVEVRSSADALAAVVAAWSPEDVQSHLRAALALDQAKTALFSALRQALAAGEEWTEVRAQQFLLDCFARQGLECDHPPIVAVDRHAGDPHYAPDPERALPLTPGSLVLVDLWAREQARPDGGRGAYADITWMATASKTPAADHQHVWNVVREARDAAVDLLRQRYQDGQPVSGADVDTAARAVVQTAGYGDAFTHRTGHSLGWESAHGDGVNIDGFETHDVRLLRPGAAFSIEPGVYLADFGVRSEINVVIDASRRVIVTTPPQQNLVTLVG